MTTAVAIQPAMPRPTPVPIAAARPRKQSKPSPGKENIVTGKPVSSTVAPVANIRTRRERPCDACRRRKSRCVIQEGRALCVLCEFHKQECTFVQSPLPRKRKVVDDGKKDSPNNQKKRYVFSELPNVPIIHIDLFSLVLRIVSTREPEVHACSGWTTMPLWNTVPTFRSDVCLRYLIMHTLYPDVVAPIS